MLLNEILSSKLYHITHVHNAVKILTENKIRLAAAVGSQWDNKFQKGKIFFLSTSRSKTNKYKEGSDSNVVYFHLNGNKLNNNFKGTQVNYWGNDTLASDEFEDRLITDQPIIDNIKKYITRVDILLPNDWDKTPDMMQFIKDRSENQFMSMYSPEYMKHIGSTRQIEEPTSNNQGIWKQIFTVIKECNKSNIPYHLYKSKTKFRSNVGAGDVDVKDVISFAKKLYHIRKDVDKKTYRGGISSADRYNFKNRNMNKVSDKFHEWYMVLLELYKKDINDDIPDTYIYYISKFGWNDREILQGAMTDIHNERRDLPRHLKRLLLIIKKQNMTLREFFESMYNKWKPKFN